MYHRYAGGEGLAIATSAIREAREELIADGEIGAADDPPRRTHRGVE